MGTRANGWPQREFRWLYLFVQFPFFCSNIFLHLCIYTSVCVRIRGSNNQQYCYLLTNIKQLY